MRIIGFLYAFYFLFLSMQPGLKDAGSFAKGKAEACCNISCEPIEENLPVDESQKKEDNESNTCNPFQFCKCCDFLHSNPVCQEKPGVTDNSDLYIEKNEKVLSEIFLDFWQPPRIG